MKITNLELLSKVMSGQELTPQDIDNIITHKLKEDHQLEFKNGEIMQEKSRTELSTLIREYLSAFANSDGGVLIIGIVEKNHRADKVSDATLPGNKEPLDQWAASCIQNIAADFSPQPRFQTIKHPDGNVLIAAVDRSLNYVYILEKGERKLYIRNNDQTLSVDPWLRADLMLGRRKHPNLILKKVQMKFLETGLTEGLLRLLFKLFFEIENESLTWTDASIMGLVYYSKTNTGSVNLPNQLLQNIDVISESVFNDFTLQHHLESPGSVTPFAPKKYVGPQIAVPISAVEFGGKPYLWKAAIYIVAKDSPPKWYQLSITISRDILFILDSDVSDRAQLITERFVNVALCSPLQRPVVGLFHTLNS